MSKTNLRPVFKHGDAVKWSSQAQGSWQTKTGTVDAVIPAGRHIDATLYSKLAKAGGSPREHESYVVKVMTGAKGTIAKYYWPVVTKLSLV